MNKTLYITHPKFNFSSVSATSQLLSSVDNNLENSEYHVSLGDLSADSIISIIHNFTNVTFVNQCFDLNSDIYKETNILLTALSHYKKIDNFSLEENKKFLDINVDTRPFDPVLWIFGCSHSHGTGLKSDELTYGQIISNELDLPLMSCTKPGSSVHWSLRHLINANIQEQDTVIWQITTPDRVSLYNGIVTDELLLSRIKNKNLIECYTDQQTFFNQLTLINFGVKYLRAKNIKFVLTSIENNSALFHHYKLEYVKYPEYCYTPNFNVDLGTDNLHVGPLSHKRLAKQLLNHIQCKND